MGRIDERLEALREFRHGRPRYELATVSVLVAARDDI